MITSTMNAIMDSTGYPSSVNNTEMNVPRKNFVIAFVNRHLNTEDTCSVFEEWADSGVLAWSGFIKSPLPDDLGYVKPGIRRE